MKKRQISLDLIRVLAIVGVVATHTENITASKTNYLGGISWWFANWIHSLVVVSVPLFIMLSGFLLLRKKELSIKYVIRKIMEQFLPPLLFWWIFYYLWNGRANLTWDLKIFFSNFFSTEIGHLYFLQIIFGLYLISPLVLRLVQKNRLTKWFLAIGTLLAMAYEYFSFLVFKTYNQTNLFVIFVPFIIYFVWGYYLSQISLSKRQWWLGAGGVLVIVSLISVLTFVSTNFYNQGNKLFWTPAGGNMLWEPFTFPVLLLSTMVFILLNNIEKICPNIFQSKKLSWFLVLVSNLSFGIYLIHPFVLDRIDNIFSLSIHLTSMPLWFYYIYRTGLVFIISVLVVLLASKIKIFNVVLGIRKKYLS
ncbi:MAG: acyltransferase [Patescibacteria group bacterium]